MVLILHHTNEPGEAMCTARFTNSEHALVALSARACRGSSLSSWARPASIHDAPHTLRRTYRTAQRVLPGSKHLCGAAGRIPFLEIEKFILLHHKDALTWQ